MPETGETLKTAGGDSTPTLSPEGRALPNSDDAFERLLLRIAAKATERAGGASLIQFFCSAAREFFQVSGVYFWRRHAGDELVGEHADGKLAEHFIGIRLLFQDNANTAEAVRQRRTIFVNQVQVSHSHPALRQFGARSLMVAPLVVFDEVIGAATFTHDSEEVFFNEDLAAKATILAGQLGSLLEATRLGEVSREEHRRTKSWPRSQPLCTALPTVARRHPRPWRIASRLLLRTRLVSVLLRRDGPFELRAVAAETPQLANSFRAGHDRQTIRFAADLAQRAVSAGEAITVSIGGELHSLGNLISPGMLIAAPFRTRRGPRARFSSIRAPMESSRPMRSPLVSAIAGFGAVAVAHAELCATAQGQAHELQQLLEISSELSSSGDLEHFLQAFVVRAADFLGYGRCFIALLEEGEVRSSLRCHSGRVAQRGYRFPRGHRHPRPA